jgi:hypothetical protein
MLRLRCAAHAMCIAHARFAHAMRFAAHAMRFGILMRGAVLCLFPPFAFCDPGLI